MNCICIVASIFLRVDVFLPSLHLFKMMQIKVGENVRLGTRSVLLGGSSVHDCKSDSFPRYFG